MRVILLSLLLLSFPAFAEEPKVYTDQDLEKLGKTTSYDEETILQREADLHRWEKENEGVKLLNEKREAEEREKKRHEATKQVRASEKTVKKATDNTMRTKKKRA